jgi:hypothetical protein
MAATNVVRTDTRQAVEPVDEVDGVDDAGDPQHREREPQPAEVDGIAEGVRELVDAEPGPARVTQAPALIDVLDDDPSAVTRRPARGSEGDGEKDRHPLR